MEQAVQIAGALLILSAFILAQRKLMETNSLVYLVLNFTGATALAFVAAADRDWGFLLLEGVWALVSASALIGVVKARRGRMPAPPGAA